MCCTGNGKACHLYDFSVSITCGLGLGLESDSWNFSPAEDVLSWEKKEWVPVRTWLQPNGERGFDVGLPVWFMSTALCLDLDDNFCMCEMPGPLGLEGMAKK